LWSNGFRQSQTWPTFGSLLMPLAKSLIMCHGQRRLGHCHEIAN
jgi:hypothetical protein